MKKSIIGIALILSMVMGLCACGKITNSGNADSETGGGKNMMKEVSFTPVSDDEGMKNVDYVKVADLDPQYLSEEGGLVYVSALEEHIELGGITDPRENGDEYYRMDASMKGVYVSESDMSQADNVPVLAEHTSGGTIRFCTNADSVVFRAEMRTARTGLRNMSARGAYGFDVYIGTGTSREYCKTTMMYDKELLTETISLPGGYVEVMINLPLYAGVKSISIGLTKDAEIGAPTPRAHEQICFYGSSITQGASASRPGNAYTNIVTRMLNTNCKNLGFSSSARGEEYVAEYIAELDMSALVIDYDHNSSLEELNERHYNFYKIIREAQPELPIVLVSKPCYLEEPSEDMLGRIEVIEGTYKKAVEEGDKNIYFVNGSEFFPQGMRELFSVDAVHPNDLGMYYMAMSVYSVLDSVLNK